MPWNWHVHQKSNRVQNIPISYIITSDHTSEIKLFWYFQSIRWIKSQIYLLSRHHIMTSYVIEINLLNGKVDTIWYPHGSMLNKFVTYINIYLWLDHYRTRECDISGSTRMLLTEIWFDQFTIIVRLIILKCDSNQAEWTSSTNI